MFFKMLMLDKLTFITLCKMFTMIKVINQKKTIFQVDWQNLKRLL